MIDNESSIFNVVATRVRKRYKTAYVIGAEITSTPPKFPAVSIIQADNYIRDKYVTFENTENVVREEYKVEVFSNLAEGKEAQTKEITSFISDVFTELGYIRTFCQPVDNADATISRRISRYANNNVTK